MTDATASVQMPRYRCHKEVWALKIADLTPIEGKGGKLAGMMMHPEEKGYAAFPLDGAYMSKHHPEVGGYYVVYPDGYKSFSPAKAFEDGYTLLS
jgi:hypothetical protein